MKRPIQLLALVFVAFAVMTLSVTTSATDRAHTIAANASKAETHTCEDVSDSESCHNSYAEGCTTSTQPNTYDAYLSYLKNLTPTPASAEQKVVTTLASIADFQNLDRETIKLKLGKQKQASFATQLADIGQGNFYAVVGYIYYAIPGGIETCNCKLRNPTDRDFHIGIGFDPDMASSIRSGETTSRGTKADKMVEQSSVIVEMTPHYRAKFHPNWTLPRVQQLEGRQVKVVGQLLVDNEHNTSTQNCAYKNHTDACWRASAWEIHPVTSLYVCTAEQGCNPSDSDGWTSLDELEEQQ